MNLKTWFKTVILLKPLRLINIVFLTFFLSIVLYGLIEYVNHKRKMDQISENIQKKILTVISATTENILEIMENVKEIYIIDPLLMARLGELHYRDGIESEILQPPPENIPDNLSTTPEKVKYWLEEKGGKDSLSIENYEIITIFLDLMIEREKANPEMAEALEKVLGDNEYNQLFSTIKNNHTLVESNDHFDMYLGREGDYLESFAMFKRNHKDCVTCHGYEGDRPLLVHFFKDMSPELHISRAKIYTSLKHRLTGLFALVPLYLVSYVFLRNSIRNREEETAAAERALVASGDVLNSLCLLPRIIPYFVTSPVYNRTLAVGGGDSMQWVGFRFRYAAFCIIDVSGHGIQETLLNIYSTSIVGNYKISHTSKSISKPSEFFEGMNTDIYNFCSKTPVYEHHFVAAVYVLLDYVNREINFSLAGNPLPILVKPDGTHEKIGTPGLILGMFDDEELDNGNFADTKLKLKAGEIVVFYSDGLMEQRNKNGVMFQDVFEKEVTLKIAGLSPNEAYKVIVDEYNRHIEGVKNDDDVSFIITGTRLETGYKSITLDETVRHPGGLISACKPLIDSLRDNGWSRERRESVESVIREVHDGFAFHEENGYSKCALLFEYISHDGILELNLKCDGQCMQLQGKHDKNKHAKVLEKWKHRIEKIKIEADEVYISESNVSFWALFKDTSA